MTNERKTELESLALKVREHIIRMSGKGGCFIGASLSCADIMTYLYADFLRIGPATTNHAERDLFYLSKGHDVPALYGVFAELGFIDRERLTNHLSPNDHLYWHPNRNIPGVEFHSGSLGHLPAVSVGVALDVRLRGESNRVLVLTGDGELNEGSVWEALLVASAYKLNNWTLVVDRNHFQANVRTEDLIPLEPMEDKFRAFGCEVKRINGHDFDQLEEAFTSLPFHSEKPSVIICDTVRGKGLPSIAERADRWFCNFSDDEVAGLIHELHGRSDAEITSETLTVR
jgi:transketolase